MRKLIVTTWISIDGYICGPNDDMSFVGESFNDEMGKYESDIVTSGDTLVLGRVTYQSFAGAWPHVPDNPNASEGEKEYARQLNAMKKIVFSKSLDRADWNNSDLKHDVDADEIARLKAEDGKDMLIYGSASVVQQLTRLGLIDEYQLLVHPVALGGGKPLFAPDGEKTRLRLVSSKPFNSGVVLQTYVPAAQASQP